MSSSGDGGGYGQPPPGSGYHLPGALADVTVERLPPKQQRPPDPDPDDDVEALQQPAAHPVRPRKPQHRPLDGGSESADDMDMDLDDPVDSHIGVRMEGTRGHRRSSSPLVLQPSDEEEDEELLDDEDEDDMGMDGVNILDSLPLEGAPIEGQEVTEADLLGKMDEDEDELDDEDEKSLSRSGEEDNYDGSKRASSHEEDSVKKKQKKDESADKQTEIDLNKTDKKLSNMRRNIREVMDETQLDEATLAAQRQEMERLRRVQEQQRIIREVQRRQRERGISLLRCNQNAQDSSEIRLPSSVMLSKVTPGSQAQRRPVGESSRWQQQQQMSISRVGGRGAHLNQQGSSLQQRIRMMTPSVSISPVIPKRDESPEPEPLEYYTDSDLSELEAEEAELLEQEEAQSRRLSQAGLAPSAKAGLAKPAKGKDVVTISSSSEDSDDDCIVLSDHSDAEAEDDPSNSGMHTNDRYNLPDEHGRVLVNVGHPDDEPDVFLAPQVARIIKPHQIGGIRFLYDNIVESIERYKTSSGFGCILAHSMGLGKTLQVATFCDIFFRCTDAKTVLCIMPINTLQNWLAEFNMWLPYEDPNKPKVEGKPIKEENSQSDPLLESKPALDVDQSTNQQQQQMPQQQQPPDMMQENPYQPQPGYNQGPVPPYGSNPGEMYDPRYAPPYPGAPGYIKTENPCQPTDMYGMDSRGMPQYNSGYAPTMQQPNMPPNMQYPPSTYPGTGVDPNAHPNAQGMNNAPSMIPQGYGHNPTTPQSNYGNAPAPVPPQPTDVKKFEDATVLDQKPDANQGIKTETKEEPKNASDGEKKESSDEKKDTSSIKTPFSVDAPLDLEVRPRHFNLHILNDSHKTMAARARVVREWQRTGGVLLIGYELYRQLSLKKPNRAKRKRGQPMQFKDPLLDAEQEDKNKPLLDEMQAALVNPGPDLVICDEGHRIKNSHASTSLALKQMRTKRRIVLTGYPLQNNLLEYWCMVDFVRPNYLGTKSEFCNMFERPIQNGQCIDSTPQDIRLMRYRAHVLHALLEGFVQRRSHTVLQMSLPQKEEYILLVRMTAHQRKLYDTFMNQVVKTRAVPNPLKAFAVCCKIWNHPDILYHFLKKRQANEEDDLDLEETMGEKATPAVGAKRVPKPRAPKGEGKRGRKPKIKPAASVQPNSSNTPTENSETQDQSKQQAFQNFSAPAPPQPDAMSTFPNANPNAQNPYQQQHQQQQQPGYQNFSGGQYNEYYGSQNQQKYPQPAGQSFPQDPQTTNYGPGCPPQQQYQGQPNCQPAPNQQYSGPSATGSGTPGSNSTHQQNQNQAIGSAGNFPQPNYSYPNQDKNFPSTNFNQNPNYPQQIPNQQAPKQTPMSDYGPYSAQNPNQAYGAHNQAIENSNMNYQNSQMQDTNKNQNVDAPNYNNSLGPNFPQQMQNSSNMIPNQPPYSNQTPQMNQNNPPASNQSYPSNQQGMSNSMMHPAGVNFNPNNPQQQQQQQQPSSYPQDNSQNQMKNYQNMQDQSSAYMQQQMPPQNQQLGYNAGQYGQQSQQQFPSQMQQFQPQQSQPPQPQLQSQQNQNLSQPQGYGQQTSGFQSAPQVQDQMGFSSQSSSAMPPNQGPGPYSTNNNPMQSHMTPGPQNQAAPYPQNLGSQNVNNSVLDSQNIPNQTIKTEPGYPQPTPQNVPANSGAYSNTQAAPHGFPTTNPQMANSQQAQSVTPNQNQYWQGNYHNQNNQYQNAPNVNQYQNNPYQGDGKTLSGNCQNNQQNQSGQQFDNYPMNTTESKPMQEAQLGQNFLPSSNTNTLHNPQRPLQTPNPATNCVPPQNNPTNPESNIPSSVQNSNQNTGDQCKGGSRANEFGSDKSVTIDSDKSKEIKSDEELLAKDEIEKEKALIAGAMSNMKEDTGIPYDWAFELMKNYVPGLIDASAKMTIFFCILNEAIQMGDRVLTFSQSLFTLNLIEDFLARNDFKYKDGQTESWAKNVNYYRLDGSTSALEREKLINEFNVNPKIHLFLVSTRAGSLGINLVGANRAIVFDASWNPCHDTQAVCRVYRYGQKKSCYVYRLVTDNCLERKIYDRQISKQGMADRVVDQCNPDAHLSLKEATTLSWDWEEDSKVQDFSSYKDSFRDDIMRLVLENHSSLLTKKPFHHESLLVDRKEKKLSQAEKRLARRGYELEKMAATCAKPSYNYVPGNTAPRVSVSSGLHIRQIGPTSKPVASVRPMQQRGADGLNARNPSGSRWIPAEVWQRQGMSAQEMTLPLDVVIPTNSPDKGSIVLKAGQRVMVLKSPKGIYMQLESGKIIAIRTALKINEQKKQDELPKKSVPAPQMKNTRSDMGFPLRNNSAISIIPKPSSATSPHQAQPVMRTGVNYRPFGEKEVTKRSKPVATAAARPYSSGPIRPNPVTLARIAKPRHDSSHSGSDIGENSNSSDGHLLQRGIGMSGSRRLEDDVANDTGSDYSPSSSRPSTSDTDSRPPMTQFPPASSPQQHQRPHVVRPGLEQQQPSPQLAPPAQEYYPPYEPPKQPAAATPRRRAPRGTGRGRGVPRVTSNVVINPAGKKPAGTFSPLVRPVQKDSTAAQPAEGYPYSQYPRYYDYAEQPRPRQAAPAVPTPQGGNMPATKPAPVAEAKASTTPAAAAATGAASGTQQATQPASTSEDPQSPTAFSHPATARPPYPAPTAGPYPPGPYDPYAQPYPPASAGSAPYAPPPAAAAPTYPPFGGPAYNADYNRMYAPFPGPPPAAGDPYRSYGSAPPPGPGYYPPFPHAPPPYSNYPFMPAPYPDPSGAPTEPRPPAQ